MLVKDTSSYKQGQSTRRTINSRGVILLRTFRPFICPVGCNLNNVPRRATVRETRRNHLATMQLPSILANGHRENPNREPGSRSCSVRGYRFTDMQSRSFLIFSLLLPRSAERKYPKISQHPWHLQELTSFYLTTHWIPFPSISLSIVLSAVSGFRSLCHQYIDMWWPLVSVSLRCMFMYGFCSWELWERKWEMCYCRLQRVSFLD